MLAKSLKRVTVAVFVTVFGVSLSGCFGVPSIGDVVAKAGAEKIIEGVTGGNVSLDGGSGAALPADWPDVPTPKGKVLYSMKVDKGFQATFEVDESEFQRIVDEFESLGYEEISSIELGEQRIVGLKNDSWMVTFTLLDDEGLTMGYVVVPLGQD